MFTSTLRLSSKTSYTKTCTLLPKYCCVRACVRVSVQSEYPNFDTYIYGVKKSAKKAKTDDDVPSLQMVNLLLVLCSTGVR